MKKILIVTGGSGGHVIPSLSIYDILKDNFEVQIATDLRGSKYINNNDYNFSLIDVLKKPVDIFFCWKSSSPGLPLVLRLSVILFP